MIGEQLDIQGKRKPVERRLDTLKKHIEQADIYFKYKGKKPLTEAEQVLLTSAKNYLKGVMNGKTTIPTKAWKEEYTKLTAERKTLNQRYLALKEEVKEAEKIKKERLQYLTAGTAGTTATQKAGYGAVTGQAAG